MGEWSVKRQIQTAKFAYCLKIVSLAKVTYARIGGCQHKLINVVATHLEGEKIRFFSNLVVVVFDKRECPFNLSGMTS